MARQQSTLRWGGVPTAVVLGDFDGDLRTDIAVLLTGSGTNVRILLGNGDGAFSSAVDTDTGADSNYNFSSIVAGDFNGDHTLDLCISFWGFSAASPSNLPSKIIVLIGNGDGTFQAPKSFILPGARPAFSFQIYLAVADFNLDNKADLAVSTGPTVRVFLGNGDGTFQSANPITVSSQGGEILATDDFNRDGKPDLVIGHDALSSAGFDVFLGKGDGTFQSPLTTSLGGTLPIQSVGAFRIADLNHDGTPDLVVHSFGDNGCDTPACFNQRETRISSLLDNGDGTFRPEALLATASFFRAGFFGGAGGDSLSLPVLGNLNGDGYPDLIYERSTFSASGTSSSDELLLGNPGGAFSPVSSVSPTLQPIASGDFNGDGLGDLVSFDNTAIYVFLNTSPTPVFTLDPAAIELTVNRGGTVTATVSIGWPSAFSSYVDLTCSVLPAPRSAPTCTLNPVTVTPAAGGTATSQLSITTTAPTASLVYPVFRNHPQLLYALWLPVCGLTALGFATGRWKRQRMILELLIIALFLGVSWTACGGSSGSSSGTPLGQYTVTVTATAGSIAHSTPVTITVQ